MPVGTGQMLATCPQNATGSGAGRGNAGMAGWLSCSDRHSPPLGWLPPRLHTRLHIGVCKLHHQLAVVNADAIQCLDGRSSLQCHRKEGGRGGQ